MTRQTEFLAWISTVLGVISLIPWFVLVYMSLIQSPITWIVSTLSLLFGSQLPLISGLVAVYIGRRGMRKSKTTVSSVKGYLPNKIGFVLGILGICAHILVIVSMAWPRGAF